MPATMEPNILGTITDAEIISSGVALRVRRKLQKLHGPGRWRKLKGVAKVRLPDGCAVVAEVHWFEAHGVGRKELKIKRLLEPRVSNDSFVLCIDSRGYGASLEERKVYLVVSDPVAEEHALVRVVDESSEDYLFPARLFVPIAVPQAAAKAFRESRRARPSSRPRERPRPETAARGRRTQKPEPTVR